MNKVNYEAPKAEMIERMRPTNLLISVSAEAGFGDWDRLEGEEAEL